MYGSRKVLMLGVSHAIGAMFSAKYTESGTTVSVDLEDSKPAITADFASYTPEVQKEISMFGLRTLMRNATAGKMDDVSDGKARTAMEHRLKLFADGKFVAEGTSKASVELSIEEQNEVIRNVIVMAKKAKGDTRDATAIITAFNGLPNEQRKGILASLQKVVDKQMKERLRQKKLAAKAGDNAAMASF